MQALRRLPGASTGVVEATRCSDRHTTPDGDPRALRLARGQADPHPAPAIREPKHVVTKRSTPVLTMGETRALVDAIDTTTIVELRDRALIGVMVYSFARVSTVIGMHRQGYFPKASASVSSFAKVLTLSPRGQAATAPWKT